MMPMSQSYLPADVLPARRSPPDRLPPLPSISSAHTRTPPPSQNQALLTYNAELSLDELETQPELLDWLIDFTFDTLGAHVLKLRVLPEPGAQAGS